jgi:hypothetical protein
MPIYVKRFRNRIGRLALYSSPSDLVCPIPPPPSNFTVGKKFFAKTEMQISLDEAKSTANNRF